MLLAVKRWAKRITLSLLCLLLILALLLSWLLATDTGFRYLMGIVKGYLPDSVVIGAVEGNAVSGLTVRGLYIKGDVDIKQLTLDLSLSDLWLGQLTMERLALEGVRVRPKPGGESEPFAGLELPIDLVVKQLAVNNIAIQLEAGIQNIDSIRGQAQWRGHKVNIESLAVVLGDSPWLEGGQVQLSGELQTTAELPFSVNVQHQLRPVESTLSGEVNLSGNLAQITIVGNQQYQQAQWPKPIGSTLKANIALADQALEASIEGQAPATVQVRDQWLSISPFSVSVQGPFERLIVKAQATGEAQGVLPASQLAVEAVVTPEGLSNELRIDSGSGQVKSQGELRFEGLHLRQTISLNNIDPGQWGSPIAGSVSGALEIDALINKVKLDKLTVDLKGNLAKEPFQLSVLASTQGSRLSIEKGQLAQGDNSLMINGDLDLVTRQLAMSAKLDAPALSQVSSDLKGRLALDVSANGPPEKLLVRLKGQAESLSLGSIKAKSLSVDAQTQGNVKSPDSLLLNGQLSANQVQLGDQKIQTLAAQLEGSFTQHLLTLDVSAQDYKTQLTAKGGLSKEQWQGTISHWLEVDLPTGLSRWELSPSAVVASVDKLQIERACWQHNQGGQICVNATRSRQSLTANASVERLPLALASPWLPPQLRLNGYLNGEVDLAKGNVRGSIRWLEGVVAVSGDVAYQADVSEALLAFEQDQDRANGTLNIVLSDGNQIRSKISLSQLSKPDKARLDQGRLMVELVNTAMIAELVPDISEIDGQLRLTLNAKGPLLEPTIDGQVSLGDRVRLSRTQTSIEKAQLTINPNAQGMALVGSAIIGGGQTQFDGQVSQSLQDFVFKINGERLLLVDNDTLSLTASPKLQVKKEQGRLQVSGLVLVPKARLTIKTLPPTAISPSDDIVIVNQPKSEEQTQATIETDVKVILGDEVSIDALGLNSRLKGQLALKQASRRQLMASGQIAFAEGSYTFYGQKLAIEEGNLYFNGPINDPRIYVKAVRKVPKVIAGLRLEGSVDGLQSTLFSEPSLPEAEILAYLLTGKPLSAGAGSEAEHAQAAVLLGLKQTTGLLGVDELAIDSSDGVANSTVTTGKQINDRLYLGYRYGIFSRTGAWLLEYTLSEQLHLESSYGESQSVDLIYEIQKP